MLATPRDSARRARGVRGLALLLAAAVVWLTAGAGCTDDPDNPDRPESEEVALELTLGAGSDGLDPDVSDQLQTDVADALTGYVVSAFLGDYPRTDFVEALDWFTSGGAELAAAHLDQLTGAGFGEAQSVVATKLAARLAPFAPGQQPAGVSAGVDFEFDVVAEDGDTAHVAFTGRLLLTPTEDGWRIFGVDLDRVDDLAGAAS